MSGKEQLAMASVPVQQWGPLYDKGEALRRGTIFQELNMPFFAAEDLGPGKTGGGAFPGEALGERERMLLEIQQVSFMLDDIRLYLDTHPEDQKGLQVLKQISQERKELLGRCAGRFYPLTADCMADLYRENPGTDCYCWEKGPLPWEGACPGAIN